MTEVYFIFLIAVFIASVSQAMLKYVSLRSYTSFWKEYFNIHTTVAYGLLFISTLISIWTFKWLPLSTGVVMGTTSYIYVALFGRFIFGEKISGRSLLSLCFIIGGVLVYSFGI